MQFHFLITMVIEMQFTGLFFHAMARKRVWRSTCTSLGNYLFGGSMQEFVRRFEVKRRGLRFRTSAGKGTLALVLVGGALSIAPSLHAQAISVNGGSIQGTITDASGAAVPNAHILLTGLDNGYSKEITTDAAGFYSVGPLNPGGYKLAVSAEGFEGLNVQTVVRIGTATPGTYRLSVGSSSETVEVTAGDIQVNTDQAGVSDVITREQIASLPVNGRNFLDLAQIEPGVQLTNGNTFDPTKSGYTGVSVNGTSGRTTRILLDGQDITDENVGTTIFDVSEGAIGEFQINHSTQDVSGDLTSTGQVLVSTRSGTNQFHGNLFYNFQNNNVGFATFNNVSPPFERNQFGGGVGGPIIKDKLFFFGESERIKQDQSTTASLGSQLAGIQAQFPSIPQPYRETYSTARLDWNGPFGGHYFVRANYDVNADPSGSNYSLYVNRDNTPGIAGGADFASGNFTHSIRGSYEKFHNFIADDTAGNPSLYNPIQGLDISFGAQSLFTGPSPDAPQQTYQSDKQVRYDGSWTHGRHNVRYGAEFNRILGGGLASFFGIGPTADLYENTLTAGGDPTNPLDYSFRYSTVGNGQGFFSEKPGFGYPAGGQQDHRIAFYLTDAWKIRTDLTLTAGIRYNRDTDRANQDLGPLPCSTIDTGALGYSPCSGSTPILDQFGPGLGNQVNQPNLNFGPQVGFAYNVGGNSKTVVRGGFGVYYDSNIWNNILFDRENRLQTGLFNQYQTINCPSGSPHVTFPGGTNVTAAPDGTPLTTLCSEPLSTSGPELLKLQAEFQGAVAANGPALNPNYVGETLTVNSAFYSPNYVSPYSEQANFGVQRELGTGTVLSVDYVHSITLKIQQTMDLNHVGAARYLELNAAKNAVAKTLAAGGYASIPDAIASGATIETFQANGLDSSNDYATGGYSPYYLGLTPDTGAAFAGANPNLGVGQFSTPSGRSGYDALEVNLREQKTHPLKGLENSNFELSYTLSRSVTSSRGGSNQFFTNGTWDNDNPTLYIGRSDLDQTHQISFGGSATVTHGPTIGLIGHFRSPQAANLTLDNTAENNIFQTDIDGDGQTGDLLQGTNPGDFMHAIKGGNLKQKIAAYNSQYAGQLTPAGQALVNAGLFTTTQLQQLNAVQQPIYSPAGSVFENPWFRTVDASVSYPIRLRKISESMAITPGVAMYNVGNLSNWTGAASNSSTLLNQANAGAGGVNSYTYVNGENPYLELKNQNRTQRQSGTFDQGDLRSTEFQLHLVF